LHRSPATPPFGALDARYVTAFTDWLACACGGAPQRAARAVRQTGDDLLADVAYAATAGHVLDFDDTFSDGVAHVSAASAPAALVLAAQLNATLGEVLDAYAAAFEAMAAVAAASHPALYERGWHPTAVCGPIGAAVAAAELLKLTQDQRDNAIAIAVLRAGGTRAAFGSDGKAIQVGLAAAAGVQAALVARGGARVDARVIRGPAGFEGVLGAHWASADGTRHIERNWIKLYPSCLGTHAPIEAALKFRDRDRDRDGDRSRDGAGAADAGVTVRVHPVARQAAHLDLVDDGLSAKFSIPYCVALALNTARPPRVADFTGEVDPTVRAASHHVRVETDRSLPEFGAVLTTHVSEEPTRIDSPRGSPARPADPAELADKIADLAGDALTGLLDDPLTPAATVLAATTLAVVAHTTKESS
jgi:2-methylcitrate dehydratase PrpD